MAPESARSRPRRVTIKDVADAAGVSAATVSRVLNGSRQVDPELARQVLGATEALHYHPNGLARSLRRAKSFFIGLLVPDITNPFCAEVARQAQRMLASAGYATILCDGEHDPDQEREYLQILSEARVTGFILNSSAHSPSYFEAFCQRHSLPAVLVDTLKSSKLDSVRVDNYAGTFHAVAHLVSRGYRRIAIIAGNQAVLSGFERLDAYRRAIDTFGLECHEDYIQTGDFSEERGYQLALKLLELTPRPQVIFAGNNTIGFGALRALKSAKVQIPQEVGLLMFDDFELADLFNPPLTVIAQPVADIGRKAAQLLLRRLQGATDDAQEVVLPPQLILRGSV